MDWDINDSVEINLFFDDAEGLACLPSNAAICLFPVLLVLFIFTMFSIPMIPLLVLLWTFVLLVALATATAVSASVDKSGLVISSSLCLGGKTLLLLVLGIDFVAVDMRPWLALPMLLLRLPMPLAATWETAFRCNSALNLFASCCCRCWIDSRRCLISNDSLILLAICCTSNSVLVIWRNRCCCCCCAIACVCADKEGFGCCCDVREDPAMRPLVPWIKAGLLTRLWCKRFEPEFLWKLELLPLSLLPTALLPMLLPLPNIFFRFNEHAICKSRCLK